MTEFFVIFAMFFMHIIADFAIQGIMADMKQREWWAKNAPDDKYKYDYIAAMLAHSFSWAFFMMTPLVVYAVYYYGGVGMSYFSLLILNTSAHMLIDDLKCNKKKINLIQDQALHLAQILITATAMFMM